VDLKLTSIAGISICLSLTVAGCGKPDRPAVEFPAKFAPLPSGPPKVNSTHQTASLATKPAPKQQPAGSGRSKSD
jgi:hypothetical protein